MHTPAGFLCCSPLQKKNQMLYAPSRVTRTPALPGLLVALALPLDPAVLRRSQGRLSTIDAPDFSVAEPPLCLPTVLRGAKRRLIFSVCFSRELSQRRFYADIMIEIPAKLNKLFMLSLGRASRISLIVFANATFCQMLIFSCYFVAVCLNTGHVRILYFSNFVLLVSNAVNICAASNLDA